MTEKQVQADFDQWLDRWNGFSKSQRIITRELADRAIRELELILLTYLGEDCDEWKTGLGASRVSDLISVLMVIRDETA